METASLPAIVTHRRYDLTYEYQLTPGQHILRLKMLNPDKDHTLLTKPDPV